VEDRPEPDFTSYELGSGSLPALIACKDSDSEAAYVNEKIGELLDNGTPPNHIAILCHAKWHIDRWNQWREQGVYVQHFEKIKGLEFPVVFIPHLHDSFPQPDDADSVSSIRRKIFTAMTRARWRLTLSHQETLPQPLMPLLENTLGEIFSVPKA
jgi:superfamily I DNA/RNA helicase